MDAFRSLMVGTNFSGANNEEARKLWRAKAAKRQRETANIDAALADDTDGEATLLHIPAPSHSLSLDNNLHRQRQHQQQGDGSHAEGPDAVPASDGSGHTDHALKGMSYKKMRNIWRKNALQVTGVSVPAPIEHFSSLVRPPLCVPHHVVTNLFNREHKIPSPVQMQAIPSLIHKRDVLACAPTGSGKTIAFLVPMFALLKSPNTECGVRALIVTPTVELAIQIEREAFFLMKGQRWRFVQHGQTTRNKDIFISTPGRIVSLVEKNLLDLSQVEYLVFDEGDRLWDVKTDFLEDIDKIISHCTRKEKVVALFTATLGEKVEAAARSVMSEDPVRIIVRGRQSVNPNVQQRLVFCGNEMGKIVAIRNLIREGITPPVLIFVQSIERSKELYDEIQTQGLHIAVMNAKMTVEEREATVLRFRIGQIWVLVTTELLSRGIDFKNVGTVVNFDFPGTVDSYIHRVGRTGRAGKKGVAITFFTEDDKLRLPAIAKVMQEAGSPVEDWMLDIKVDRRTQRRLETSTPHRAIISTKKRMLVARKRTEQQLRRYEAEQAKKKALKKLKKQSSDAAGESADSGDE